MAVSNGTDVERTASPRGRVWHWLIFAAAYGAALAAGNAMVPAGSGAAVVWPATGVLVAGMLWWPIRLWWGVIVLGYGLMHAISVVGAGQGTAVAIEPGIPAEIARWVSCLGAASCAATVRMGAARVAPGATVRMLMVVLVGGGVGTLVATGIGVAIVRESGMSVDAIMLWQEWWFAEGLGILLVTPVVCAWWLEDMRPVDRVARPIESLLSFGLLAVVTAWVFQGREPKETLLVAPYLAWVPFIWAALRLDGRVVGSVLPIFGTAVAMLASAGEGDLAIRSAERVPQMLGLQLYLAMTPFSVLLLASVVAVYRRTLFELRQEIDLRERGERRQRIMMDELDHRVKNNLSQVLGLIELSRQTSDGDLTSFARSLTGRVHSLAAVHESLAHAKWEGVELRDIVTRTLQPYEDVTHRVMLDGPPVHLSPRASTSLAMCLHELATNAVKHGSLSMPDGRITVVWRTEDPRVDLRWIESGGPRVESEQRGEGVGLTLIEGAIAYELGGSVKTMFKPDGLECRIDFDPTISATRL